MRKKRNIQRKKDRSIAWIAGCLLFLISLGYSSLYALETPTKQGETSKLSNLYVLNEEIRSSDSQNISLNAESEPLLSVLKQVAQKVHVGISYQKDIIPNKNITIHIIDTPVFQALEEILKGTRLEVVMPFSRDVLVIKKKLKPKKVAQTGSITGTITNEEGEPVPTANVLLVEISRGAATNLEGEYTIEDVEAGTYTLRVTFVGYQTYKEQVTISVGEQTIHNIALKSEVRELEQLVVTGAGVVTEKKRLGQSIGVIGGDELDEAPVSTVSEALQGRVPGLVANSIGEVGSAAPIRIRGTVSLTQRNGPLIYVDGVRVDGTQNEFASIMTAPLSQINPENIARIVVLKGAAAATLYGTEASSGVIQIFTKRGINKPTQWTFKTTQGIAQTPLSRIPPNVVYDSKTDQIISNEPAQHFVNLGNRQEYNLSVRGGTGTIGYFASAWFSDVNGSLPTNAVNNLGARVNLTMRPLEDIQVRFGLNKINYKVRAPYPSWGLMGEFVIADPRTAGEGRPYGELFHSIPGVLAYNNTQTTNRSTLSGEINYQFSEVLSTHFLIGYHKSNQRGVIAVPPGPDRRNPTGWRNVTNSTHGETTLEFSVAWNAQPWIFLSSKLIVGLQSYWEQERRDVVGVKDFAVSAVPLLRGGSTVTEVDEFSKEVISAGIFAQEQLGLNDRLFLTAGLRVDGNSTFGDNFGFQPYPRVGMSWIISDAPFWGIELFDLLRLRAAYGTSGLQPGVYDALRTWRITSLVGGNPVLLPGSYGNKNLKPERSREIEIGANIVLFDNQLDIDMTYYWQRTSDAILARQRAPSAGFLSPQLVNIGELESQGLEVSANWITVDHPNLRWEIFGTFATRMQTVTDLGGIPGFKTASGARTWNYIAEGYQPGAVIGPVTVPGDPYRLTVPISELTNLNQIVPNFLLTEDGERIRRFQGNQLPTIMGSLGMTLNLPEYNLSFSALLRAEGGFVIQNEVGQIRVSSNITSATANMVQDLKDPSTSTERRREIADNYSSIHPQVAQRWAEDGDYLQLQKVSVSWEVPANIASIISAESASVTLAGRNLWLFTGYSGIMTPGATSIGANDFAANVDYFAAPTPRQVEMSLRVTF